MRFFSTWVQAEQLRSIAGPCADQVKINLSKQPECRRSGLAAKVGMVTTAWFFKIWKGREMRNMRRDDKVIDVYNVEEIAKVFGVNRMTVYRWNKKGILPLKRIGGRYFAQKKDLENILLIRG